MANNYMWLTCTVCKKQVLLAKYMPDSWGTWDRTEDRLDTFFEEHKHYDAGWDVNVGPEHWRVDYCQPGSPMWERIYGKENL